MQTCAKCKIAADCPIPKNPIMVLLPNNCIYFVPEWATVLDLPWMIRQLEKIKT